MSVPPSAMGVVHKVVPFPPMFITVGPVDDPSVNTRPESVKASVDNPTGSPNVFIHAT
ncbi:MAG: hypothetical protein IPG50_11350 [Myxococcales bacterium]|nr:hypothetical protein [Myxococcales bacterium]